MFFILCERRGNGDWIPNFERQWDNPVEAATLAKERNTYNARWNYDMRYRVRKVVDTDDDNFLAREAAKNHTPIPWERSDHFIQHYSWQCPHIDPANDQMVRFFSRLQDAISCTYRSIKISRFLANYEDFTDEKRTQILIDIGFWDDKMKLEITTDPEMIQTVYRDGPSSCMADEDDYELPSDPHPVAVYGNCDLALAYLGNEKGGFAARAIVWPDRKIYHSIYGETMLLTAKLKEAGYTYSGCEGFDGAKVRAIKHGGEYLMPYIDVAEHIDLSPCGKFFVLTNDGSGDYYCKSTTGYVEECDRYDDDDYDY